MIQSAKGLLIAIGIMACVTVMLGRPAWGGPLRIGMTDGTSVEVSYYWESDGQVKFDIPGGIIGVPESQVAFVTEVLESKEFDLETIVQGSDRPDRRLLQDIIDSKTGQKCEIGDPKATAELLKTAAESPAETGGAPIELVRGQSVRVEKSLPAVCPEPGGATVVVQDILSSRTDLRNKGFNLVLYNAEGKVIQSKPCEVYPLNLDQETQKKLDLRGKLYLVRAVVKPDPKIKRYEITTVQSR